MKARFSELLGAAQAQNAAVGAFTAYNLETAIGVVRAAARRKRGVILLVSERSFDDVFVGALVAVAERASVPVCVQLDHSVVHRTIEQAFELGAGAVLAAGSKLPFEHNVALVQWAAGHGEVEAELGGIEGDEDVATAVAAGALTDPEEAADFVRQTGAACLAVSIGNVHGTYREPPELDWARLEAIRERVDVPLSLHGASGLTDDHLRRAISLGIAKVNVNTELREQYLRTTELALDRVREGANVLALNSAQSEAVAAVVEAKLAVYDGY